MSTCAVPGCRNNPKKCKKEGIAVQFFRFPETDPMSSIWKATCRIESVKSYARVCSIHFIPTDYKMGQRRIRLNSDAVPSQYLMLETLNSSNGNEKKENSDFISRLRRKNSMIWEFGNLGIGNLSIPSLNFLNLIRKWEKYFELYHTKDPSSNYKYKINRNYGVVEGLATRICHDFPEIPKAIIKYFVKVRTCIRIKDLNIKLNQWRASKRNARKLGQFAQSSFPGVNFKEESEEE